MKEKIPWVAAGIGGFFVLILYFSGVTSDGHFRIPLLMMLLMSELGCIVTAFGAYIGIKEWQASRSMMLILLVTLCAILFIVLGYLGIHLWDYITMERQL